MHIRQYDVTIDYVLLAIFGKHTPPGLGPDCMPLLIAGVDVCIRKNRFNIFVVMHGVRGGWW